MPYSSYPQDSDIADFLAGIPGIDLGNYEVIGIAASAQREWERMTGYIPFLADSSPVARTFDPPGMTPLQNSYSNNFYGGARLLELKTGLVVFENLIAPNRVMVQGVDFRLTPVNAPVELRPYKRVEFFYPIWGPPSSIVITGQWGYALQIPDDAYKAIIRLGASMVATDILQGIFAAPTMEQEGDEKTQQDSFRELGAGWQTTAERIANGYRNIRVGL